MRDSIDDYIAAKEAAKIIGIDYSLLMARIYKGKVTSKKVGGGWGQFIHKDEVERERKAQKEMEKAKDADNQDMEGSTG